MAEQQKTGAGNASQRDREPKTESARPWHSLAFEEVVEEHGSGPDGLPSDAAEERLQRHGPNALEEQEGVSIREIVLRQLKSPLIYMLAGAAVVSISVGELLDAGFIVAVVALNTVIGVVQEWRAEEALAALSALSAPKARVIRDGQTSVIDAVNVVPGDVLVLESGDRVAADARIIKERDLRVDESALTGESEPVKKTSEPVEENAPLADRESMVWMSSSVTAGRGRAIVVATGMDTSMGEIAGQVRGAERSRTPLQQRLDRLAVWIGGLAAGLAFVVFGIGVLTGYEVVEMLLFSVAVAVSAIPEGLPAVVSVVLAVGVRSMAKRKAIVRRLPAVETLGSTTVICSDKTGTISRNQMTVRRIWAAGERFEIEGEGFEPEGAIISEDGGEDVSRDGEVADLPTGLAMLLLTGLHANEARLEHDEDGWQIQGDPTEGALVVVGRKAGFDESVAEGSMRRVDDIPFSSDRKYMATLDEPVEEGDKKPENPLPLEAGNRRMHVKGAVEVLLSASTHVLQGEERVELTDEVRGEIERMEDEFADEALRVMAGAYRDVSGDEKEISQEDAEQGLTFVGIWGMLDPPRPEAIEAIRKTKQAGIRVVMITGDYPKTAAAIAEQAGIEAAGKTMSGSELEEMSDEELRERVGDIAVYARVSPTHKIRIVKALQDEGEIVAVTGDGVNDAPALKESSIGVAMGLTGTEVAKEAADMVLADDNFATIVKAIEEGRVIFNNLRNVVFFLLTTNLGEILTLGGALLLGLPLPLTAVMILWVNLVTDGVSDIPVGLEPKHQDMLQRPPRPVTEGVINAATIRRILLLAPVMAVGTLALYAYELSVTDYERARTVAFTTLVAFEWFRAFSSRSQELSLFQIGLFSNKWLLAGIGTSIVLHNVILYWAPARAVLDTVPLTAYDWIISVAVASSVLVVDEIRKIFTRRAEGISVAT